jgi:CRP-like cAMP-binding protein
MLNSLEIDLLARHPLFQGMAKDDIPRALFCLRAEKRDFHLGSYLFHEGEEALSAVILLKGEANLLRYDERGDVLLVESFAPGDSFGEVYALEGVPYGLDAVAKTAGTALYVRLAPLFSEMGCAFGQILLKNLVLSLAEKNQLLKAKLMVVGQKGLEGKVWAYLASYPHPEGQWFSIPYSREEFAEYLACDRSALSRLLSEMQEKGLLEMKGRQFRLKSKP